MPVEYSEFAQAFQKNDRFDFQASDSSAKISASVSMTGWPKSSSPQ